VQSGTSSLTEEALSDADQIITKLGLAPHPEGGWYRQTWQGPKVAGRPVGTAIHFLLKAGERSHWHRVDADEIWLWHAGATLTLSLGRETAKDQVLGPDVLAGQSPQIVVPKDWWQAARSNGAWTLVSCTVSPGFRFSGFELAEPGFDLPR
jgi:predicted cupin superfamily sugar epimerase